MSQTSRRVVVTQNFFDGAAIDFLRSQKCDVEIATLPHGKSEAALDLEDITALLAGAGGWIVGHARVTRVVMEALPDLKIISRRGVGYERVDIAAARELGRVVTIAAGGNDATVADQVIGMMIGVGRRFREAQAQMQAGSWKILVGSDLYRKTVGIVGLGRIGRSLVQRLRGFETSILVATPRPDLDSMPDPAISHVDLKTIWRHSDYISLHAPLTSATRHMINTTTIADMKPNVVIINTARGGLVNDADLLTALQEGRIAGAGLDVFESESDPRMQGVTDALLAMPNVIAAPHAGASTREGLARTNMIAAEAVVAVLDGGSPAPGCVIVDGRPASPV